MDEAPRHSDPRDVVLTIFTLTGLVGVALAGLALGSTPAIGVAWAMAGVGVMAFLWTRYLRVRAVVPLRGRARAAGVAGWFALAFLAWWYTGDAIIGTVLVVPVSLELTRPARRP